MSSLPSSSFTNASGEGQADQSTPNTLRKDPLPRPQPVSAVSKSKLVKPRASAVENEGVSESQPSVQQPSGSISKTNRLRKALGVVPSGIPGSSNTDSNQSNGESYRVCLTTEKRHSLELQSTMSLGSNTPSDSIAKGNLISFLRNAVSSAAEFGCRPLLDLWSGAEEWSQASSRFRGSQTAGSLPAPTISHEPGSKLSASSNYQGSRKPSGHRNSPSSSPIIAKQLLSSTAEPTTTAPSRPNALRSQSYSKRHASFDTPREVPMPSMPFGSSSIDPIALDDEDMDRNETAAAGWGSAPRQGIYQQSSSRQPDTSRRPTADSPSTSRKPSAAIPPASENAKREGMHIDITNETTMPPPQLSRNNSAPTPPHTPSSERMDLRYPQKFDNSTPDSAVSSAPSGSGSEQISPAPFSAQVNTEKGGYMEAREAGAVGGSDAGPEGTSPHARGRMDVVFKEGRLSTSSLPLPRSYGAERVSRLPAPVRPANTTGGNASGSGSGSDSGLQAKTPTNFPDNSSTYLEESDLMKTPSTAGNPTTYRTSYPFTGTFARDVPLIPGQPMSLVADIERNTQPGTAWRSSGPFMRRDYSEDDREEKSAISSGQTPKQPEVEAPRAPPHPFFATPNLTPSTSSRPLSYGASSTTATPGHDLTSPPLKSSNSPGAAATLTVEGGSPAASVDRTSTASGSSGASSNLDSFSERLASELERKAPSGQQQQGSRNASGTPRNDNPSQGSAAGGALRPPLTTEHSLASTNQGPTMTVDTTPSAYILEACLPGYQRDEITLSTRKKRILHVVADGFVSGGGHFERRVSFGYDADMSRVRAEFNGSTLRITVPRRPTPQTFAASLGSSATVGGGSSSGVGGTAMFWRGRSNAL